MSVRTPEHRLIFKRNNREPIDAELFDLRADRDPLKNLAGEQPEVVRQIFNAWRDPLRRP